MTELGRYVEIDGRPAVELERTYPHPIERVWSAITDPAELQHWFPSSVEIELVVGGAIRFAGDPHTDDVGGVVLALEPPTHLAFSWGPDDELRFDLEPVDDGHCRFRLTNLLADKNAAARNGAGWVVCLGELEKLFAGTASGGPHSADAAPWEPVYDEHVAAGLPSGALLPASPA